MGLARYGAHPSHSGLTRGDGNSGSTALNNSVRYRLDLRRSQAEDDAAKDPNARILEVVKSNYGPVGASLPQLFRDGAFFCDGDGDARNSLAAKAQQDRVLMKLLHIRNENGRRVNPYAGNNYAPKAFGAHPDAEVVTKKGFKCAMERAFATRLARVHREGPPSRPIQYLVPGGRNRTSTPFHLSLIASDRVFIFHSTPRA